MAKTHAPVLRFKGFDGDWEKKALGDLADIYDGTHQTPKYTNSGVMFLSVENISTLVSKKFISDEDFKQQFKIYPENGDVLMTRIGDVGTTNVVTSTQPLAYYVTLALLKPRCINSHFLSMAISSSNAQKDIDKRTLHVAFPKKINKGEIEKVEVQFPKNKDEQTQIGDFFRQLDEQIAQARAVWEKSIQLKKAMLAKMFPVSGSTKPQIRFKGFTGDWERKKLGDFGKATSGTPLETEFCENGDYKVISIGSYSENSTYIEQGIRVNKNNKTEKRILNKDDLTMILNDKTSSGRIIGRVLLIEHSNTYVHNQRTQRIEINKNEFVPLFLYHLLNADSIRQKIILSAQGNTQIYVNWSSIKNLEYLIPSTIEEQTAIGDFFRQLDKTIALQSAELSKLNQLKKGLLSAMLI